MSIRFPILISIAIGVLLLSACKSTVPRSDANETATNAIISSTPPFQTKEPERYQAVRSMTFSKAGSAPVKTKTLLAKDGEMRRDE